MNIYLITNKINGKRYVGQTISYVPRRWARHQVSGYALYNAVKKYGKDNFQIEIIDTAESQDELNQKEVEWIEALNTLSPNGYNLMTGGRSKGRASEETREKQSRAKKGKKQSPDAIEKRARLRRGKPLSDEHKRKIGDAQRGEKNHMHGKAPWNSGIPHSEETKRRVSASKKGTGTGEDNPFYGKKHTDETKALISQNNVMKGIQPEKHPMYGKKHTEETQRKMRAAKLGKPFPQKRKPVLCVTTGEIYESGKAAAADLGIATSGVSKVLNGKSKQASGYVFQFIEKDCTLV